MYRGTISAYTAVDKANILNEFFYSIFSADQETLFLETSSLPNSFLCSISISEE